MEDANRRAEFAQKMTEHMDGAMKRLNAQLSRDKVMTIFDAIALEAVRLKIEGWDQMTFAALREALRVARSAEQEELGTQRKAEAARLGIKHE